MRIILLATIVSAGCVLASHGSTQADYGVVSLVTLDVGNGVRVQATIESLRNPIAAIPGQRPRSKLVIKNVSTDTVIHQEECGDSTLSYPGFDVRRGAALVMTTKGGSGDGIRVYEVTETDVRIVLTEAYRAAVIVMPNDELAGDIGFLVVDSDSGTSPLVARRYQYNDSNSKYVLTGTAPFSQFINSVKAQFGKPAR